jgi:putative endonuclease
MGRFFVYITTNRSGGLYIGVTNDLERRISQHKDGNYSSFTSRYRMHRLVYSEEFSSSTDAIAREKQLKGWRRSKKVALIEAVNPTWRDLLVEE